MEPQGRAGQGPRTFHHLESSSAFLVDFHMSVLRFAASLSLSCRRPRRVEQPERPGRWKAEEHTRGRGRGRGRAHEVHLFQVGLLHLGRAVFEPRVLAGHCGRSSSTAVSMLVQGDGRQWSQQRSPARRPGRDIASDRPRGNAAEGRGRLMLGGVACAAARI